jgi:hypothetical protein
MHLPHFIPFVLSALLVIPWACAEDTRFRQQVVPFLETHCVACHSGDEAEAAVAFDRFTDSAGVQTQYQLWEKVIRLVQDHQMPPTGEQQPSADEIAGLSAALKAELATFDCSAEKRPGRVTLRRLNRAEYNNTVRDLTGLNITPAADFPSDDVGEGFDNIGDVLTISPILLEKYLTTAEAIAAQVIADDKAKAHVFPHKAETDDKRIEVARRNIAEFASRAFRRPVTDDEKRRLFELMKFAWENDTPPEQIQETVIAAILANPNFLFRVESGRSQKKTKDEGGIRELNDYELASRLSYFLWSTMPDKALIDLASKGKLRNRNTLAEQARRMLADERAVALVKNFAGQWLQLRDVPNLTPDPKVFPDFDSELQAAMLHETEMFLGTIIREDHSVLDVLNADYTFVNDRLAKHYGIPDVAGKEFRKVTLSGQRRGVLTHASILMLTSNPGRTSPVKRGKWILENILAEPPPPPPADVPELAEDSETLGSLREQLEQHRSNPACAVCHVKMDALGFAMENFDAVGAWRDKVGRFDIDASAELPGGRKFTGAAEMLQILSEEKKTEFCRCLTGKLLTYALGRGMIPHDRCVINDAVKQLEKNDYRFSALVTSIVTSAAFVLMETSRD